MHTNTRWAARAEQPANFPDLPTLKQMQIDYNTTPILESRDIGFEVRFEAAARGNEKIGIRKMHVEFDFKDIMQRAHNVIAGIAPHSSTEARGA